MLRPNHPYLTWHLDVDSNGADVASGINLGSVHPFTFYVSWVQNDVNQFGLYLLCLVPLANEMTGITAFLCMLVLWSTLSTLLVAVLFRTSPLTRMANLSRHNTQQERTDFSNAFLMPTKTRPTCSHCTLCPQHCCQVDTQF